MHPQINQTKVNTSLCRQQMTGILHQLVQLHGYCRVRGPSHAIARLLAQAHVVCNEPRVHESVGCMLVLFVCIQHKDFAVADREVLVVEASCLLESQVHILHYEHAHRLSRSRSRSLRLSLFYFACIQE